MGQQDNTSAEGGSKQDRILDLLTQLVSQLSNDKRRSQDSDASSWTSRRGPERGVRWRGGTPPAPPVWRNSSDLRAFSRWEKKIQVWSM